MEKVIGYVVLEYNQASGWPRVIDDIYGELEDARDDARSMTAMRGSRGETYRAVKLVAIEEEE